MLLKTRVYIAILIAAISFAACTTDPYLATNLQPSSDLLNGLGVDTLSVFCKTVKHDSVATTKLQTLTIGKITNNSTFGTSEAGIYMQFNLPASQFSFDAGTVIDSAFIMLPYRGNYGETTNSIDISATLIDAASTNTIAASTIYYSNKDFALSNTVIGSVTGVSLTSVTDSTIQYGKKILPCLKIPITNASFKADLLTQSSLSGGSFYDNTNFHKYLNGVYLATTSTNTNGFLQLASNNADYSGIMIYYHTATDDSLKRLFPLNTDGTVNRFKHDYTGSKVQSVMANSNGNQDTIYVSGLAGIRSKIMVPGLAMFKNTIINKAQVIFEEINPSTTFIHPNNLLLTRYNPTTGGEISLEDITEGSPIATLSDANYYGGIYTSGKFTFNISRYLQKLANGTYSNDGFFIEAYNAAERPAQVVLGGGNQSAYKIKFRIIYTKIK
ncbi:MAG: hypothetical protein RI955_769 [Bacteroidota bacterium]